MLSTEALARLEAYQRAIRALLEEGTPLLGECSATNRSTLAHLRWRLVRELRAYQMFKHAEIFDALMQSGDAAQAVFARDLKARCVAADAAFRDHVTRWSATDVAASWHAYVVAAHAIVAALHRHLASEKAAITVLLAGTHRTRRPAV